MIEVTIRIQAEDAPALLKEVAKLSPEMMLKSIPDEPRQSEEKTEYSVDTEVIKQPACEEEEYAAPVSEPEVANEPVEEPNEPAEEEKPDAPETKTYKKEEVRAMLAKARDAGHNIKAILKPYGANLTAVAEKDYAALMADTLAALGIEEEA